MTEGAYLRHVIISRCTEEGECLIWPGAMNAGTSPALTFKGKNVSIRRWLWANMGRKLPAKGAIKVKCKDKRCVAEAHLIAGRRGPEIGSRRSVAHKVKMAALRQAQSTLTLADVEEIRMSDLPLAELVAKYGKAQRTIQRIQKGEIWRSTLAGHFAGLGAR